MKAKIIDRKWIRIWFSEAWCNQMPNLIIGYNGTLLAEWAGGALGWNGDPIGRDGSIWLSRLERGAKEWSVPEALGSDMQYTCHDPCFIKNKKGEIMALYAKFLDTEINSMNWCKGRETIHIRKSLDGGYTWLPEYETNIPRVGHASNNALLLPNGDIVLAFTSGEDPNCHFGKVRILLSKDDGETWQVGPLLETADGTKIREPALALRPNGDIQMFTRTCPADRDWGGGVCEVLYSYRSRSSDGGLTWTEPVPSTITNNESKLDLISCLDGSLLMVYNNTNNLDWHERSPLWLARSTDEGDTWENILELEPGPGNKCQPAMCQSEDGLIHVVYMHRHTAVEHLTVELKD